jgi:hypothetical protein
MHVGLMNISAMVAASPAARSTHAAGWSIHRYQLLPCLRPAGWQPYPSLFLLASLSAFAFLACYMVLNSNTQHWSCPPFISLLKKHLPLESPRQPHQQPKQPTNPQPLSKDPHLAKSPSWIYYNVCPGSSASRSPCQSSAHLYFREGRWLERPFDQLSLSKQCGISGGFSFVAASAFPFQTFLDSRLLLRLSIEALQTISTYGPGNFIHFRSPLLWYCQSLWFKPHHATPPAPGKHQPWARKDRQMSNRRVRILPILRGRDCLAFLRRIEERTVQVDWNLRWPIRACRYVQEPISFKEVALSISSVGTTSKNGMMSANG